MRIFRGIDEIGGIRNAVVSTGSFDGVHIGHKVILKRMQSLALASGGESVLITFHPHPRKVLYPESQGKDLALINTQREKTLLLRESGLQNLIIIPFTLEFAQLSSIDFIRKILAEKLRASTVVVGFNHHFGHNREGDFEFLYELGRFYNFKVEEIPAQDLENETVSSTRIRKALNEGHIQRANAYLDHHYIIMGGFEEGDKAFSQWDFQNTSVTIEEEEKLLPPPGLYAATASIGSIYIKALLIIRPNAHPLALHHFSADLIFPDKSIRWTGLDGKVKLHKTLWLGDIAADANPGRIIELRLKEIGELIY